MDTDVAKRGRLMYAKSLAKSVVKKQAMKGKIEVLESVEVDERIKVEPREDDGDVEMDIEMDTSLWCGEEVDIKQEEVEEEAEYTSDEDDDEPVVDARSRKRTTTISICGFRQRPQMRVNYQKMMEKTTPSQPSLRVQSALWASYREKNLGQ